MTIGSWSLFHTPPLAPTLSSTLAPSPTGLLEFSQLLCAVIFALGGPQRSQAIAHPEQLY